MVSYAGVLDGKPPRRRGWWRILRHLPGISVLAIAGTLIAIVMYPYVIITVPSGQVGVLWKRFNGIDSYCWCFVGRGTLLNPRELRDEGLHVVWPWDKLFLYDLRLHSSTQTYNAISKDGVNVAAQLSIRFQLRHNSVGVIHKFIGPQYLASVVSPEIGSQAREVISQYTAQEVYTSREEIQEKIRLNAQKSLGAHLDKLVQPDAMEQPDPKNYNNFLQDSIQILDTLVLGIELPPAIVAAINRQTEQFYQIQEFKFRVEREAQESKRKQIEANGIAAFQRTVSQGISDSYLRWRGIEATILLAQSPNSKVVIIGSGKDGLPIILGNVDAPATPGPGPKPADGAAPSTPPAAGASTGTDKKSSVDDSSSPADANSVAATPASPDAKSVAETSATPAKSLDLSDIEAIVSRITERLRPAGTATSSGTTPPPKP
jgi:regulator of protease activity HflC (stomatin/prohibitin superfamily)